MDCKKEVGRLGKNKKRKVNEELGREVHDRFDEI